jgi:nitroreductase
MTPFLKHVFLDARTANGFLSKPVSDEQLHAIYEVTKMGATSMNTQPARYVFLRTPEAKARLLPCLSPGNVAKVEQAPVTVIVANDTRFFDQLPHVWHVPNAKDMFEGNAALSQATAFRNGTLSGAYFMVVARSMGLDCGPMSGFDPAKVNAEFFPDGQWQANFLINLGHADVSKTFDRNPRLSFEQACRLL